MMSHHAEFCKWLVLARLVPGGQRGGASLLAGSQDVTSAARALLDAWSATRDRAASRAARERAQHRIGVLLGCLDCGIDFWAGPDQRIPQLVRDWLQPRGWCWLKRVPASRRVAVVSSRLPRLLDPHGAWLCALRAALLRILRQDAVAIAAHESAGAELVLRGALLQQSPAIRLHCCDPRVRSAAAWARRWAVRLEQPDALAIAELWGLPPEPAAATPAETTPEPGSAIVPERDRAVVAWADEVIALSVRAGGNVHTLLRDRLVRQPDGVMLCDLPGLQSHRVRDELVAVGAQLWRPPISACAATPEATCEPPREDASHRSVVPLPTAAGWDFLAHTTRACLGPWPGQSREEYLDDLLLQRPGADHSPLAALLRIVAHRRLSASGLTIRGRHRVVSFTAVPLAQLPRQRVFRSHRGRWDFEPYGIAIRRCWLEARGARPVRYGDESFWQQLADDERPFFQLVRAARRGGTAANAASGQSETHESERSAAPSRPVDWSQEREWRHLGDLDLSELAQQDALVFVPDAESARTVLGVSPWPVTVLGGGD